VSENRAQSIIEAAADARAAVFRRRFEFTKVACQSPIEEILLAGLMAFAPGYMSAGTRISYFTRPGFEHDEAPTMPGDGIDVHMQASVGKFRADFLLDINEGRNRRLVVVECDGHEFHERTKDQARHDKRRDRFMTSCRITVLRFAGSELYADVESCIAEIADHVWRLTQEMREAP
jgi:very-short-patch-repair endonuclease